jgi:hypothetical protein
MPVATDEDFEDHLDQDLAWRRSELQSLMAQLRHASATNPDSPAARALCRSTATLLYAHWEGYTRLAFETYLKLILRRKPFARDAADGLLVEHISQLQRRLHAGDEAARTDLVSLARGASTARLRLSQDRVVNTKSNLRFQVLQELLGTFGLSESEFVTKKNVIDVLLCDRRNEIAHGRDNFPSQDEVLELHKHVLTLIERLRDLLIGCVRSQAYRIPGAESGVERG